MRFAVKQRFVVVFYALLFHNGVKVFIKSNYKLRPYGAAFRTDIHFYECAEVHL